MASGAISRHFHLRGATGTYRTAKHEGKDYLVVPVTAMVEGVIRALNSKAPELVLAEEFSIAPFGWNGRPVMMNHPMAGDKPISANSPEVLAASCFGTTFNTSIDAKRLIVEAWLDTAKAAALGGEAQATVTRILTNVPVEVSVGVFCIAEESKGVYAPTGKAYSTIWRNIIPDHLALLKEGDIGACSNAMGCGTQRAAILQVSAEGFTEVESMPEPAKPRSLRERLKTLLPGMAAAVKGYSQSEVKDELREALKKIEPLYRYMEDVWESDGYVVYCVCEAVPGQPLTFDTYGYPNEPYLTKMYRRDFTMTKDGAVTFADTRTEVEYVGYFEPVAAEGQRAACSCGGKVPATAAAKPSEGDSDSMEKKTRIAALMASKHSPIKEQAALEALSEAGLTSLETLVKAAEDAAVTAAAAEAKAAEDAAKKEADAKAAADKKDAETRAAAGQPAAKTREQWLAEAPPEMRSSFERIEKAEIARKTELVDALKGAQKVYSETQLKAMSLSTLEETASLLNLDKPAPVNYSGVRALKQETTAGDPNPAPDGYRMALDARAGKAAS